jgi:tetratricopeptide (TPR) repeat protein
MSQPDQTTPFVPQRSVAAPGDAAETAAPDGLAAGPALPPGGKRYRLLEEMARGGMGVVYRAHDTILDREIALKVLQERFALHSSIAQRFVDEARITSQLQHPGIPAVHDLGNLPDGRPFLAMKLVKGRDLADWLWERPSPSSERGRWLAVFEQLCQAVAYAHAHQVIHRDLKPLNVMVGSFGEVQVMDWGLAKLLTPTDAAPKPSSEGDGTGTEIRLRRDPDDSATLTGSVLGTPAYMPPEQAGGETDKIDARADVFGLGAVLCVILTGQPPYAGRDTESVRLMAVRGQLEDCLARLDACTAEPGLVQLCRRCLAFDPADRPQDAAVVAQQVAALRAQAEERARQAELERVRAEVAVREQRKRRRMQLALVAAVLLVLGLAGGGLTWLRWQAQTRRAEADRSVTLALARAEQLAVQAKEVDSATVHGAEAALGLWRQAVAAGEQAESVAATTADEDLTRRVMLQTATLRDGLAQAEADLVRARRDLVLVADLDKARGRLTHTAEGQIDWAGSAWAYQEALQSAGLPTKAGAEELAAAIRAEKPAVREALISALDQWAFCLGGGPDQARLRSAADRADGDPLRRQIRAALASGDKEGLVRLAETSARADLPAITAVLLGEALSSRQQLRPAEQVLRAARERHPSDFGVLTKLGNVLGRQAGSDPVKAEEAVSCMRAALAVRPNSPLAHLEVGWALHHKGDWAGAETCFRKTIALDPRYALAHNDLGTALDGQGDRAGAEACFRRALELDANLASAHYNLGNALHAKHDLEGALACYRQAIRIDPRYARAHCNLGNVLRDKQDLDGAIACFRKAIQFDPNLAPAHNNLGIALRIKNDLDGAITCYRKAIQIDPNYAFAHNNLGIALQVKKDLDGAIHSFRQAIQVDPNYVEAYYNLGNALRARQDLDGAIACFRRTVQIDPRHARAHNNLGIALRVKQDLVGAIACYRQAIQLDPKLAVAHYNLGNALRDQQDLVGATACYRQAIQLDPRDARAHTNLGSALREQKDLDGAIACFRQALQLNPRLTPAHNGLGLALADKQNVEEAIACFRTAIELNPKDTRGHANLGWVLERKGDLTEAEACYRRAVQLAPQDARTSDALAHTRLKLGLWTEARDAARQGLDAADSNHPFRSALQGRLVECEKLLAVAPRVLAALAGEDPSTDNRERLVLAQACVYRQHPARAARLFAAAFADDPAAADDLLAASRYTAACSAVLAGCGQGENADKLKAADRAALRKQALVWLRADLNAWKKRLAAEVSADRLAVLQKLSDWLADPDLEGVRPGPRRIDLPEEERSAWDSFWEVVRSTQAEANKLPQLKH